MYQAARPPWWHGRQGGGAGGACVVGKGLHRLLRPAAVHAPRRWRWARGGAQTRGFAGPHRPQAARSAAAAEWGPCPRGGASHRTPASPRSSPTRYSAAGGRDPRASHPMTRPAASWTSAGLAGVTAASSPLAGHASARARRGPGRSVGWVRRQAGVDYSRWGGNEGARKADLGPCRRGHGTASCNASVNGRHISNWRSSTVCVRVCVCAAMGRARTGRRSPRSSEERLQRGALHTDQGDASIGERPRVADSKAGNSGSGGRRKPVRACCIH